MKPTSLFLFNMIHFTQRLVLLIASKHRLMKVLMPVLLACVFARAGAQPVVTNVSPLVGYAGSTVTISGSGFNSTAANNTVYFGNMQAVVSSASATSLTVTVPAGTTYSPITVFNAGTKTTGISRQHFLPSFNNSADGNRWPRFSPYVNFSCVDAPLALLTADLNNDGKPDLIAASDVDSMISVLINTATTGTVTASSFATSVDIGGICSNNMAIGDIDGDGKLDIVGAKYARRRLSILHNTSIAGTISFDSSSMTATGSSILGVALGDVDDDGKLDLISANEANGSISVFLNTSSAGTISFGTKTDYTTSANPSHVIVTDIDGDGKSDIVVYSMGISPTVSVFRRTGAATFATRADFSVPSGSNRLTEGDIDGDGLNDVAMSIGTSRVGVMHNESTPGTISFGAVQLLDIGKEADYISLNDVDGDGKPDMAVSNGQDSVVSLFRNTSVSGTISFESRINVATHGYTNGIVFCDINEDGRPELIVSNNSDNAISVFSNLPFLPVPQITSVSPSPAIPGTSVTINGTNFNTTAGNNIVYFGAEKATVSAATETTLSVAMPAGATYKPVTVYNSTQETEGASATFFLPGYDNSLYVPGVLRFKTKVDFATSNAPQGVALCDVDGDGKPDLVTTVFGDKVVVYRNISTTGTIDASSFGSANSYTTDVGVATLAVGDVDGDGKPDLLIGTVLHSTISIFLNKCTPGTISFAAKSDYKTISNMQGIALADIDGDGRKDIATVGQTTGELVILRNSSLPGVIDLDAPVKITTAPNSRSLAFIDADNDGKLDIAVVGGSSNRVAIHLNICPSPELFGSATNFSTGSSSSPRGMTVGDIDGDGKTDIIVASSSKDSIMVFRNASTAAGTPDFETRKFFCVGDGAINVALGDLDADGKPDVVATNNTAATVSILRNTSSGSAIAFDQKIDSTVGTSANAVFVGDADGDGKPEIVVANSGTSSISILQNNPMSAITGNTSVCANGNITLSSADAGGVWTSGNTTIATVNPSTGVVRGVAAGTATISYTLAGVSATTTVTVQSTLATAGSITGTKSACVGATSQLTDNLAGGTWTSSNTLIATVSATGGVSGLSAGTVSIDYTLANSCNAISSIVSFTVNALPVVSFTTQPGATGTYAGNVTYTTQSGMTNYIWSVPGTLNTDYSISAGGTGTGSNTVTLKWLTEGSKVVTVNYTDNHGCNTAAATSSTATLIQAPPIVTSLSPSVGLAGSTVTISGANFNTTAGNNIVYFGATRATVTAASTNSLTVTVPAGNTYVPASVLNTTGGLAGYAPVPYLSTYDNSAYAPGTVNFATRIDSATGNFPNSARLADFDGDGKADVVGSNFNGGSIYVYRNTGTAGAISFAQRITLTSGNGSFRLSVGDIDGDGKPDIAVPNRVDNTVSLFRNTSTVGNISFAAVTVAVAGQPGATDIADIDGDGKADLLVSQESNWSVTVLRNVGAVGTFSLTTGVTLSAPNLPYSVCSGDIDGDGKRDIAVASYTSGNAYVFRNTSTPGAMSFGALQALPLTTQCNVVSLSDIDGDGRCDLMAADFSATAVAVYRSTSTSGSISFDSRQSFQTDDRPSEITVADFNGDGRPDYAISTNFPGSMNVLLNTSTAGAVSFATRVSFPANAGPMGIAAGDLDGDGKPDIALTCQNANKISIYRNNPLGEIVGAATVCAGSTLNLSNICSGGKWTSSNTTIATVNAAGIVTGVSAGSVTITYSGTASATLVGNFVTAAVTVKPLAVAGVLPASFSVCEHAAVSLSSGIAGGVWSSSNTSVATVSSGGVVTAVAAGLANISYTVTNSCNTASVQTTMTIIAQPSAGILPATLTLCQGVVTPLSTGVNGGIWSSTNTAVATVDGAGAITAIATGTATLSYVVTNSCNTAVASATVTVNPLPEPATVSGMGAVCAGNTRMLSASVAGGAWASDNTTMATVSATGVVTGVAAGVVAISYTVGNSCGDTTTAEEVTVMATPPAITGVNVMAPFHSDTLSNAGGPGTWSSSAPVVATINATTGIVAALSPGTTVISFTNTNGCSAATSLVVSAGNMVCVGQTIVLSNGGIPGGNWISGAGSIAKVVGNTGVVTGVGAGRVIMYYVLPSGAFRTQTVTVNALSQISGATSVCQTFTSTVVNATPGGGYWTCVDPQATINSAGVISGITSGVVTIYFTTTQGCVATRTITVYPTAPITGVTNTVCASQTIVLTNDLAGGSWSTSSNSLATVNNMGVVRGVAQGVPRVSYIWPNGCHMTYSVTVNALSQIGGGTAGMCQSGSMTLTNTTPYGGVWSSSNTAAATISTTGVVRGVGAGSTIISFTSNASGCVATKTLTVNACRERDTTAEETTGIVTTGQREFDLKLFPNPNAGSFMLQGMVGTADGKMDIEIVNVTGQVVYRSEAHVQNGNVATPIDMDMQLPAGVYVLNATGTGERRTFHFILQR